MTRRRYLSTVPYCQGLFMTGLCIRSDGYGICSLGSVISEIPRLARIKGCIVKCRFACYFFQLRHIDGIRIFCAGSYVDDLTGIIFIPYGKRTKSISFEGRQYGILHIAINTIIHRSLYYTFLFIITGNRSSIGYTTIPDSYSFVCFHLCTRSDGYPISCRT